MRGGTKDLGSAAYAATGQGRFQICVRSDRIVYFVSLFFLWVLNNFVVEGTKLYFGAFERKTGAKYSNMSHLLLLLIFTFSKKYSKCVTPSSVELLPNIPSAQTNCLECESYHDWIDFFLSKSLKSKSLCCVVSAGWLLPWVFSKKFKGLSQSIFAGLSQGIFRTYPRDGIPI